MEDHDISTRAGDNLPRQSGPYLVRLRNYDHLSEYLSDFVVSDYVAEFNQFRFDLYAGNDGTLEPTDITALVEAWWYLPE